MDGTDDVFGLAVVRINLHAMEDIFFEAANWVWHRVNIIEQLAIDCRFDGDFDHLAINAIYPVVLSSLDRLDNAFEIIYEWSCGCKAGNLGTIGNHLCEEASIKICDHAERLVFLALVHNGRNAVEFDIFLGDFFNDFFIFVDINGDLTGV